MSETKESKSNSTLRNIGLLLLLVVAGVIGKQILGPLTADAIRKSTSQEKLTVTDIPALCDEVNKGLPTVVNEFFAWDRLVPNESGATMQVHLTKHTVQDITVDQFREEMKTLVSPRMKSDPTMKRLFDSGLSLQCDYTEKNGAFVCSFTIDP